jgi:large subunit ribosomal protein L9e
MRIIKSENLIAIPNGVDIKIESRKITVKGKHGTLVREFKHVPVCIEHLSAQRKLKICIHFSLSKQLASLRTVCSHISNMISGVTQKFRYEMRLVYAHFPINASVENGGKTLEIRNFLGEKVVRVVDMLGDTKVFKSEVTKDCILLEGTDLELTSRSAALIHQSCLCKRKDIRKFLDGIYVSQSGPIPVE